MWRVTLCLVKCHPLHSKRSPSAVHVTYLYFCGQMLSFVLCRFLFALWHEKDRLSLLIGGLLFFFLFMEICRVCHILTVCCRQTGESVSVALHMETGAVSHIEMESLSLPVI